MAEERFGTWIVDERGLRDASGYLIEPLDLVLLDEDEDRRRDRVSNRLRARRGHVEQAERNSRVEDDDDWDDDPE